MPHAYHPVLALTVHDPNGRLYALTKAHLPEILPHYHASLALHSPLTPASTLNLLRSLGVNVQPQPEGTGGVSSLGTVRRAAIAAAAELGGSHCHLCDHDRALHWFAHYPEEMAQAVAAIADHDLLIFGRTPRAFATHPQAQQDTERLITRAFELAWGQPWDVTAGSRGLSLNGIRHLLAHASEPSVGNDGEWPLVLRRFPELEIGYMEVEGLEFETADRYQEEVLALGSTQAWIKAHYDTLASWQGRIHTADVIVSAIRRAAEAGQSDHEA